MECLKKELLLSFVGVNLKFSDLMLLKFMSLMLLLLKNPQILGFAISA